MTAAVKKVKAVACATAHVLHGEQKLTAVNHWLTSVSLATTHHFLVTQPTQNRIIILV